MYVCIYYYNQKKIDRESGTRGLRNKAQRIFKKGNSHTTVY